MDDLKINMYPRECREPEISLCAGSARFINVVTVDQNAPGRFKALVKPIDAGSIAMAQKLVKRYNAYPQLLEALRVFADMTPDADGGRWMAKRSADLLRELGEL